MGCTSSRAGGDPISRTPPEGAAHSGAATKDVVVDIPTPPATAGSDAANGDAGTPAFGTLKPGARRNSVQTREEPALPLSPSSRLRTGSVSTGHGHARDTPPGWELLHVAADAGDLAGVLVELDVRKTKVDKPTADNNHCTALWLACKSGRLDVARNLLEKHKARVNAADKNGQTPLHAACVSGRLAVVSLLVKNKADLEAKDREGETPLFAAVMNGHAPVTELLLDSLASLKVKNKQGWGLLCAAAHSGSEDMMDLLLVFKNKLNLEERDSRGQTPLYIAASRGHLGALNSLLHKGADMNPAAADGTTALWVAAYGGHTNVVTRLLKKGGALPISTARGELGKTFADGVSMPARLEVASLLQRYCAADAEPDRDAPEELS